MSVRDLLEEAEYPVDISSSCKNDTALWNINDVDIAAVSQGLVRTHFNSSNTQVSSDEAISHILAFVMCS